MTLLAGSNLFYLSIV